jgi:hypothetical protein
MTQNVLHRWVFVFDTVTGSDYKVSYYLDGTSAGADDTFTGYTAPTTETPIIGKLNAGTTVELEIAAVIIANATALSSAQVSAWDTQVTGGGSLSFPTGTTHLWDADDAGATWVDQEASVSLAEQGTVSTVTFTAAWS